MNNVVQNINMIESKLMKVKNTCVVLTILYRTLQVQMCSLIIIANVNELTLILYKIIRFFLKGEQIVC